MPIYKTLCDTRYLRGVKAAIGEIAHLPLVERLVHHNARRPLIVSGLGVVIMVAGCLVASNKEGLEHSCGGHHVLYDVVGLFLHGVGAVPLIRYFEPVWLILLGAAEEVAPAAVAGGAAAAVGGAVAALDATVSEADTVSVSPPKPAGKPGTPWRGAKRRKHGKRK